jgi:hypothetical protein
MHDLLRQLVSKYLLQPACLQHAESAGSCTPLLRAPHMCVLAPYAYVCQRCNVCTIVAQHSLTPLLLHAAPHRRGTTPSLCSTSTTPQALPHSTMLTHAHTCSHMHPSAAMIPPDRPHWPPAPPPPPAQHLPAQQRPWQPVTHTTCSSQYTYHHTTPHHTTPHLSPLIHHTCPSSRPHLPSRHRGLALPLTQTPCQGTWQVPAETSSTTQQCPP